MNYKNIRNEDVIYKKYKTLNNYVEEMNKALATVTDKKIRAELMKLCGFGESEATKTKLVHDIMVDESLAAIIQYCIEHNIKTIASCSGLAKEHNYDLDCEGYIAFEDTMESRNFINEFWEESWPIPELDYVYFIPAISVRLNHQIIEQMVQKIIN